MLIITILLIGIVANLDNVGISISYGLRFNRIPLKYNIVISLISTIFAFLSISVGGLLADTLSFAVANIIGGSLLIVIGAWLVLKSIFMSQQTVNKNLVAIDWKEAIILGFILALNCLSIGFGAGITGVSPLPASLSVGIFSVLSIIVGVQLGHKIGLTWFGRNSDVVAGILLIIIGLYEMFI